jgi:O-antigen/teichoic acid export membrane protein
MTQASAVHSNPLLNFALSGTRMCVAAGGAIVVSVMTARTLGTEQMGIYSFITWIAGTLTSLASMGLSTALSRFVAEYRGASQHDHAVRIARKIVFAQVLLAAAISVLAAGIWPVFSRPYLLLILIALAAVTPSAVLQTLLGLMEGAQRFDQQVIATLGGSILQVVIVAYVAARHASTMGFLTASLLASFGFMALTLYLCRPMLQLGHPAPAPDSSRSISRKIFSFSLSVYGFWFLSMIVFDKSELFFLRAFQSPAELAFYSIAFALTARMATAGDSISNVLFPMFVTRYAQQGPGGLRDLFRRALRYTLIVAIPVCLWGIPLTPRLLRLFYGAQYAPVAPVLQILLITMLFTLPLSVNMSALFTMDEQFSFLRYLILVAALNLLLDLLLIPRLGAVGAAAANGISQALAACGPLFVLHRKLPGSLPMSALLKAYVAGVVSAVPIAYAAWIPGAGFWILIAAVTFAVCLYPILLLVLRVLQWDELSAIKADLLALGMRKAS